MNRIRNILLIGFIIFLTIPAFAHMCHDPFRPRDRLVLMPDKDLIRIEKSGEFRMYIENTFSSILRQVRLFVESPSFDINIEPPLLKKLAPGERTFFLVRLKLREGLKKGDHPLRISVGAKSAELRPSIEKMAVIVDEKIPELPNLQIKPEKEEIIPAEEKVIVPEEIVAPEEAGKLIVKVERLPFYMKPYFYTVLILLWLGILIWRKRK